SGFEKEAAPPQKQRRIHPLLAGAVVVLLLAIGIGWYIYAQGYEDTDDAEVDGHLNPIASRIDGTIQAVHVDDNQSIHSGMLLVELDPRDEEVALKQAQAQYDQALTQLSASHPNLPITRIGNRNDLTS